MRDTERVSVTSVMTRTASPTDDGTVAFVDDQIPTCGVDRGDCLTKGGGAEVFTTLNCPISIFRVDIFHTDSVRYDFERRLPERS